MDLDFLAIEIGRSEQLVGHIEPQSAKIPDVDLISRLDAGTTGRGDNSRDSTIACEPNAVADFTSGSDNGEFSAASSWPCPALSLIHI